MNISKGGQIFYVGLELGERVGPLKLMTWLIMFGGTLNESNFGGDIASTNYL